MDNISGWCFRLAIIFILVGMGLGEYMAVTKDHIMVPVHAHLNLLGWVSLAIFGAAYKLWPAAAEGKMPVVQVALWCLGLLIQMGALVMILRGMEETFGPLAGIGSLLMYISMILFAIRIYRHAKPEQSA